MNSSSKINNPIKTIINVSYPIRERSFSSFSSKEMSERQTERVISVLLSIFFHFVPMLHKMNEPDGILIAFSLFYLNYIFNKNLNVRSGKKNKKEKNKANNFSEFKLNETDLGRLSSVIDTCASIVFERILFCFVILPVGLRNHSVCQGQLTWVIYKIHPSHNFAKARNFTWYHLDEFKNHFRQKKLTINFGRRNPPQSFHLRRSLSYFHA